MTAAASKAVKLELPGSLKQMLRVSKDVPTAACHRGGGDRLLWRHVRAMSFLCGCGARRRESGGCNDEDARCIQEHVSSPAFGSRSRREPQLPGQPLIQVKAGAL